jgi:putative ABC transport system permease protein
MLRTALRFILFDKPKSIGALAGAVISIFLIGQQLGIFIFLTNAMGSLVRNNQQYIWVVDEITTNANALALLDNRIGKELESIPGVKRAYPWVISGASARFENGKTYGIQLIGSQAPGFHGGPWNLVNGKLEDMIPEGAIITEFFDRKNLGDAEVGDYFEVNGKKVYIAGQTNGVRSFGGVFTFTTIERARALTGFSPNKVSAFLVEKSPNASTAQVVRSINGAIKGVRAWDAKEFTSQTVLTVLKSSGIALSVGTLIVFALISGFVIIGLTLYSAAIDRIRDYGTLKAIGATNSFVRNLILTQAALFSLVGFVIGYSFVEGFRRGVAASGTYFSFPLWMQVSMFLVTLGIAIAGSYFAISRISKLEPAAVFRG